MEKRSRIRIFFNSFARCRLIARPIGSGAIIAIGDPHRQRNRLRALFLKFRDPPQQCLLRCQICRAGDTVNFRTGHAGGADDLVCQQHLPSTSLGLRSADRLLHILRKPCILPRQQAVAVRLLQHAQFLTQRSDHCIDARIRGVKCLGWNQWMIHLHVAKQRGLQLVIVLLRNRVKLVVVTPGALYGQPHDTAPDGRNHVIQIFVAKLRIVLLAETHFGMIAQEAGCRKSLGRGFLHLVASQLFH